MQIIKVKNICKTVRKRPIYQNISLTVEQGDCYALIGGDNEGKTSILYAILGFHRPDTGEIVLFEEETKTNRNLKRIGFVPDELLCFEKMTGAQLLDMTIRLRKLGNCLDYAEELIDYFKINPALFVDSMDEDMNKCTYIISALLSKPELLILDEPFNFLSNESAERLKEFISEYRKKGNTILIIHENYEGVADVCTKFSAIKDREQIRRDETPQKYRKKKLIVSKGEEEERLLFSGEIEELKQLIAELPCRDFTVQDISIQDQILKKYDWLEEEEE